MFEFLGTDALTVLLQVVLIDLVLAGDNAIVIGLAAAGLPEAQRGKAILIGIVAATMLRILFAGLTTQILQVVGLLFAGGFCCCGYAGKCGESCAPPLLQSRSKRWRLPERLQEQIPKAGRGKHSSRRLRRSLWLTFPCRSTTSWPSQGRHASIQWF